MQFFQLFSIIEFKYVTLEGKLFQQRIDNLSIIQSFFKAITKEFLFKMKMVIKQSSMGPLIQMREKYPGDHTSM